MSNKVQITHYAHTTDAFSNIVLDATANSMVPPHFRQEDGIYSAGSIEYFAMLLVFPTLRKKVNITRAESLFGMNILSASIGDSGGMEEEDPTKNRIINYLCSCALTNKTPEMIFDQVDMPESWYELIEELNGTSFPNASAIMNSENIFENIEDAEKIRQCSPHFECLDEITNIYRSYVVMDLDALPETLQLYADADNVSVNAVELECSERTWRKHWLLESATEYAAGALAEIATYFGAKVPYKRLLTLHRETVHLALTQRSEDFFPIEGSNTIV